MWWLDDVLTCRLQLGRLAGSERVANPPSEPTGSLEGSR
jgi:hypothetical protein